MTEDNVLINRLWSESKGFNEFWQSYFFMITHPKQCLRMINFAIKVLSIYKVGIETTGATNAPKNDG